MIRSKLPSTGTSIFSVMSKLAAETGAINLGQGFPGFPIDDHLAELVTKAMHDGFNQYAPMPGIIELREQISRKIDESCGKRWNPDTEITITSGATQAIYTAITALVHPGDEVILFAPAYDCYAPAIELSGGIPVWISLSWPDYAIPWEEVRSKITSRTRMIVINSPHNPSGTTLIHEDFLELINVTRDTPIIILSDEVYEHVIFDGQRHVSISAYPELACKSIITYSFGKTFHATGWKLGYSVAPSNLMNEFRKVHQYNVFACHHPTQVALAAYMKNPSTYQQIPDFYQKKRDLFLHHLNDSKFEWRASRGTYFQLLRYRAITSEGDTEVAMKWTRELGVASIPVSVFYPDEHQDFVLRFCFAKEDEILEQAGKLLKSV